MNLLEGHAYIDPRAKIGPGVVIGPFSYIGPWVRVGKNTRIDTAVRIEGPGEIGSNCEIFHSAAIGLVPQDLNYRGEESSFVIGSNNIIREFVTVHRATGSLEKTEIGDDNFLMAYVHVAHNVRIGSRVIIANGTQLAGYVEIHDYAYISGLVAIHQYVRIGKYAFVGGLSRVTQDVPPFFLAVGNPLGIVGVNIVGLKRHGFDTERIRILREAYRLLYRSGLNTTQAIEKIKDELPLNDEIHELLSFVEGSERGITKKVGEIHYE